MRTAWLALTALAAAAGAAAQPGLDPSTAAIAEQYAQSARACMAQSATMAVRAGVHDRRALVTNTQARCGSAYVQFLTAHGETARQGQQDLERMAGEAVDAALAARRR